MFCDATPSTPPAAVDAGLPAWCCLCASECGRVTWRDFRQHFAGTRQRVHYIVLFMQFSLFVVLRDGRVEIGRK